MKSFGNLRKLYQEAFPVAQAIKNLPAMQKTWVQSLALEDSLEKEMATHSSILVLSSWTEEPKTLPNCGAREDFESPLDCKEIKPVQDFMDCSMPGFLVFHYCELQSMGSQRIGHDLVTKQKTLSP